MIENEKPSIGAIGLQIAVDLGKKLDNIAVILSNLNDTLKLLIPPKKTDVVVKDFKPVVPKASPAKGSKPICKYCNEEIQWLVTDELKEDGKTFRKRAFHKSTKDGTCPHFGGVSKE